MSGSRIEQALQRIEAAMARIDIARASLPQAREAPSLNQEAAGSANIMALINNHERLREEVADTMRDLDALIEDLGG